MPRKSVEPGQYRVRITIELTTHADAEDEATEESLLSEARYHGEMVDWDISGPR